MVGDVKRRSRPVAWDGCVWAFHKTVRKSTALPLARYLSTSPASREMQIPLSVYVHGICTYPQNFPAYLKEEPDRGARKGGSVAEGS